MDESEMIGGNGIEVEIDESKFGKGNTTGDIGLKVSGSLEVKRSTIRKEFSWSL